MKDQKTGGFALPSFGSFTVKNTKIREDVSPRTGELIEVTLARLRALKLSEP